MALSPFPRQCPAGDQRPLQIRVRGLPDRFAEWELIGALAGLARERDRDVEVEWMLDDASSRWPRPAR